MQVLSALICADFEDLDCTWCDFAGQAVHARHHWHQRLLVHHLRCAQCASRQHACCLRGLTGLRPSTAGTSTVRCITAVCRPCLCGTSADLGSGDVHCTWCSEALRHHRHQHPVESGSTPYTIDADSELLPSSGATGGRQHAKASRRQPAGTWSLCAVVMALERCGPRRRLSSPLRPAGSAAAASHLQTQVSTLMAGT